MQAAQDRAWLVGSTFGTRALGVHDFFDYLKQVKESTEDVTGVASAYASIAWIYRCANLRANTMGGIPWEFVRKGSDNAVEDWPLADMLTPLLKEIEYGLCIWGASFTLKQSNRVLLKGLQWLNPSTMQVKGDENGVQAFVQQVGAVRKEFMPKQIIYHRLFNPDDDIGPGTSPARVALQAAKIAWGGNTYVWKFFENGAVPAVLLTTDAPNVPTEEVERIKTTWERIFGGVKRAFKTAVLTNGLTPTVVGSPLKDVDMAGIMAQARTQVAVAFGIPETMLADAANYATAKEHRESFYYETIFPEADYIAQELNRQLLDAYDLEFRWKYSDVETIQQDEGEKADWLAILVRERIITKDEAREQLGYDPLTAKQKAELEPEPVVPMGPDGEPVSPQQQAQQPPQEARGLAPEVFQELGRWRRKVRRGGDGFKSEHIPDWLRSAIEYRLADETLRERALEPAVRAIDRMDVEKRLQARLLSLYEAAYADIAEALIAGAVPDEALVALGKRMVSGVTVELTAIVADEMLALSVGHGVGMDYGDVVLDAAEWARQYSYDLVKGIQDTQRKHLQDVLGQMLDGKLAPDDARAMIAPLFGDRRAASIAITETTRATAKATEMYQRELADRGIGSVRRWLTAEDERVCAICGPLDHKTEEVWKVQFPSGPPAHPNCRCAVVLERLRANG